MSRYSFWQSIGFLLALFVVFHFVRMNVGSIINAKSEALDSSFPADTLWQLISFLLIFCFGLIITGMSISRLKTSAWHKGKFVAATLGLVLSIFFFYIFAFT